MKAHELARKLLAGPDLPVFASNPTEVDYPLSVCDGGGEGSYSDLGDDEDDEPSPVVLLKLSENDGILAAS